MSSTISGNLKVSVIVANPTPQLPTSQVASQVTIILPVIALVVLSIFIFFRRKKARKINK